MNEKKSGITYLLTFFLYVLLQSFFIVFLKEDNKLYQLYALLISQFSLFFALLICVYFLKLPKKNILIKKDNIKSVYAYLLMPIMSLILIFCFNDINNIVLFLFEKIGLVGSEIVMFWNTPFYFILAIFAIAILPAFVEELLIRGYTLSGLNNYKPIISILISAYLFSILHMNIMQLLFQFMLGIVLGILVILSKRIDYSIILHFFNNDSVEIVVNAGYILKALALSLVGVLSLIICLFLFSLFLYNKKQSNKNIFKFNIKNIFDFLKNSLFFKNELNEYQNINIQDKSNNNYNLIDENNNNLNENNNKNMIINNSNIYVESNKKVLKIILALMALIWLANLLLTIYLSNK